MAGSNDNFISNSIVGNDSFLKGYSIYYTWDEGSSVKVTWDQDYYLFFASFAQEGKK